MSIQKTEDWFRERLGKATASRISDVVARTKTGWSASREGYMAELICERLTGVPYESYTSAAMQRGADLELEARNAYEFAANATVEEVGFVQHPDIPMSGASPDGLVGEDGLVEIKCPNTSTHIKTLLGASIDRGYILQMQWQMACAERVWCDWVSYDPRLPENMNLFVQRVPRDDAAIHELEIHVVKFLMEMADMMAKLERQYTAKRAAA